MKLIPASDFESVKALYLDVIENTPDIGKHARWSYGKKAVRLDVLKCNVPAQHLYEKAGYVYRGEQNLYAENTGWIDFLFYEKLLVT